MTATQAGQGELPVGLARLIHINALACDLNRVVDYRTKQLEVRLLASYLDAPGAGAPLQIDHQAFVASSRHIRSFVTESSGLGMLTAASEALFAWDNTAHALHSFDALPGRMLTDYPNGGVRPDLLFHLPGGRVAGEARGRHRRAKALLPKQPLAEQRSRLQELALWSASHRDHAYFMSWVWIGRSGIAVDIFLPQDKRWDDALDVRWKRESEGHQWRFPVRDRRRRPPEGPFGQMPTDDPEPPSTTDALQTRMSVHAAADTQTTADPLSRTNRLVQRLYDTAPELDAELAGIPVRGAWVPADALGPARHEVLLAVLAEQPPPQTDAGRRPRRCAAWTHTPPARPSSRTTSR
ncbi:hypothetical protein ACIPSJ_27485 [Streptomyces sp. NPDC090088]|uniref:hypothetical protein n=1 Tax=Streptomyces sp. NPDC090088 TaxID=3365944 RepID=UPI003814F797